MTFHTTTKEASLAWAQSIAVANRSDEPTGAEWWCFLRTFGWVIVRALWETRNG